MPPKYGPLTPREEEHRTYQAKLKDAKLKHQVVNAIKGGAQATAFIRKQGRSLQVGGSRKKLQNADGTLTDAGRHYHEHIGEDPPHTCMRTSSR